MRKKRETRDCSTEVRLHDAPPRRADEIMRGRRTPPCGRAMVS